MDLFIQRAVFSSLSSSTDSHGVGGGIYSTIGPVLGAIILGLSSEYLKLIMPYGHLIIYGVIIVVVVLFAERCMAQSKMLLDSENAVWRNDKMSILKA